MWRDRDPVDPARVYVDGVLDDLADERRSRRALAGRAEPGWGASSTPVARRPGMAPVPRLPRAAAPPPSTGNPPAEPFLVGINQPKCYAWTTTGTGKDVTFQHDSARYGPEARALDDAPAIGLTVYRQVGDVDLTWPGLCFNPGAFIALSETTTGTSPLAWSGIGTAIPDPRAIAAVAARLGSGGGGGDIVRGVTIDRLAWLLEQAMRNGARVILTFLHLGNGGASYSEGLPAETSDPSVYGTLSGSTEYTAAHGRTPSSIQAQHFRLRWAPDHVGATIRDDELPDREYAFPQGVEDPSATAQPHLEILDPWCPYKRQVIHRLAVMAGQLLVGTIHPMLRARVAGYSSLQDVIYGIELFNEIDHNGSTLLDGTEPDPDATGEAWGRTCYHAARGLHRILGEGSGVRILLPGLSSYQRSGAPDDTWEGKLAFTRGLARGFAAEFRERAEEMSPDEGSSGAWSLSNITELVQGMDVHSYHFRPDAAGGLVHCGRLVFELEALREAILEGLREALERADDDDPEPQVALFTGFPLTVLETTTTVVDETEATASASDMPDFAPFDALEDVHFQAWEVWRRLGSALAANAAVAGWHSWMAGINTRGSDKLETAFAGSGIREDIDAAELGTRRPAWSALERLAHHLGRASWGRMVLPAVSSRDALLELETRPTRAADRVVVFEYRVGSEATPESWYYLVLIDPAITPDAAWANGGVHIVGAADGSHVATVTEHLFLGLRGGAGIYSAAGATRALPLRLVVAASGSGVYNLYRPRLYESPVRLAWEAWVEGSDLVGKVPDWLLMPAVLGW